MLELPEAQMTALADVFERSFPDDQELFALVDLEEVFALLIGDQVNQDIYDLLNRTSKIDVENYQNIIFLRDWMDIIELGIVDSDLQFWELANNCKILKTELNEIIEK